MPRVVDTPKSAGASLRRGAISAPIQPPSGHVFRVERKRGPVWYAKYRLSDGRQLQRKLGPAWSERGRPPAGYYTKRLAEDFQRARKVHKLPVNPVSDVEKPPQTRSGDIYVYSPEEVWALVRAAASEQDGATFLMAAFTGLRLGELIALHWRDVDFTGSIVRVRASYAGGALTTPKSGKARSVPLAPEVAKALAKLSQREHFTGDDDLVFAGETGSYLDGSALRRRYKSALTKAGLRPLRFHDLRHTFGTRMIAKADIRRVQEWMGHADIQTTMRYLHYAPREEDARLVAEAFRVEETERGIAAGLDV
jgi:integrase